MRCPVLGEPLAGAFRLTHVEGGGSKEGGGRGRVEEDVETSAAFQ